MSIYARPHPDPLPLGEGEAVATFWTFGPFPRNPRYRSVRLRTLDASEVDSDGRVVLPLLGERVGVRASVLSDSHSWREPVTNLTFKGLSDSDVRKSMFSYL